MDWTINLERITKTPVTVEEAVSSLIIVLDNEHKRTIALMKEDDLVDLHFSLGAEIRNGKQRGQKTTGSYIKQRGQVFDLSWVRLVEIISQRPAPILLLLASHLK